jgi:hypothetical protein
MTTPAIPVAGSTIKISQTAATSNNPTPMPTMVDLSCIGRDVQLQPGNATENDTTAICSTAKEFILGLRDFGSLSVTGHWKVGDPGVQAILEAASAQEKRLIQITFSDGSTATGLAYVRQPGFSGSVDGVWSGTYSFRFTGEVLFAEEEES